MAESSMRWNAAFLMCIGVTGTGRMAAVHLVDWITRKRSLRPLALPQCGVRTSAKFARNRGAEDPLDAPAQSHSGLSLGLPDWGQYLQNMVGINLV